MLIERQEFNGHTGPPSNGQDDTVFRYYNFSDLDIEGKGFDGALIGCTFRKIDWYWSLFNPALFSRAVLRFAIHFCRLPVPRIPVQRLPFRARQSRRDLQIR